MKKILLFFILVLSIGFTSCDTLTTYTFRVSVDIEPTLTILNQTGYPVVITAPVSANTANGAVALFQPTETQRNIDVIYRIGQVQFTEQVTWNNRNATLALTKRPQTLIILNQTGHSVVITAPVSESIANGATTLFLPTETNRRIDVVYRIGQLQFTEQVTMSNADVTATLRRSPSTITVVNQTGRPVVLTAPVSRTLHRNGSTQFISPVSSGNFNIDYTSGLTWEWRFSEQVTIGNQDVTVNLTRRAPILTFVNNTGAGNNINVIQFRPSGRVEWIGGNIIISDDELQLTDGTAHTGITTQLLVNGDRLSLWVGALRLSGSAFDIRLQTSGGVIFQRDNVQITSDMTLTFTQSDRR